jgi:predicted Zn-dependent protease
VSLPDVLEKVLKLSKADDCIVIGYDSTAANIRWASNSVTTNGVSQTRELVVISIIDRRVGVVASSYFPTDRLEDIVRQSEAACRGQEPAEDYMELLEGDTAVPEGWLSEPPSTGVAAFGELIPGLGRIFDEARESDVRLFGFAEHSATAVYLLNSRGLCRRYDQKQGLVELNAKTPDFKKSVWAGQATRDFSDVSVESMFGKLKQRLSWGEKSIALPAGRYEVLLEPSATADMLIYQYWTSAARNADEGRTVFSKPGGGNKAGQQLFPESITVYSDPKEPGLDTLPFEVVVGSGSYSSVFDNGVSLGKTEWIKNGVLKKLITTRYWAKKTKTSPAPAIDNLVMEGGDGDLEGMIAKTKRGLLITCFWYIREVDPQRLLLTGLTRDGVFLIEDGKVKGAVNNFRYNMSPVDMLAQTIEMGMSVPTLAREFGDYFTLAKVPPIRVKEFNMSSVSEAT